MIAKSANLQLGDTIGILGGGQLGRMLAMNAARLGFRTIVLDPTKECPASQVCNQHLQAEYNNYGALDEFCDNCMVVTYEFENIPNETISYLAEKVNVFPPPKAINISCDRLLEKKFLEENNLNTVQFSPIKNLKELHEALEQVKLPTILKTRRFGYDGKGQISLPKKEKISKKKWILAEKLLESTSCILEIKYDFKQEISVIAARTCNDEIVSFDPAENKHINGILHTTTLPASINNTIAQKAISMTCVIMRALDYVGVIGVEFFVGSDGSLFVNEFAPRVHNSGHWTEAACTVSQFEQHIRAITGLSLASTKRHSDCLMQNLIGDDVKQFHALARQSDILIHLYGKKEAKPGRKMGHYTRLFDLNSMI